jgi:hypothetical protein
MPPRLEIDHLVVAARTLAEGAAHIASALGVRPGPGGVHPSMGTHNLLLSLGAGVYLEVIAVDPSAPPPGHPRWFSLDGFSGPPRLVTWVARTDDLDTALAAAPDGGGTPVALSRGPYSWCFGVTADGRQPFDLCHPALISWQGDRHPADDLPDAGVKLVSLRVEHPDAVALRAALAGCEDPRLDIRTGGARVAALISTPSGPRVLA